MNKPEPIKKTFLKTWSVNGYYQYQIWQVDAGTQHWLIAEPVLHGVTRCANTEQELLIVLKNDCINMNKFAQKVKQ